MGSYILTPNILKILEKLPRINGSEIQLTDDLRIMAEKQNVYAYYFNGKRYYIGDKFGFIQATIDFTIKRPELKKDVLKYIKTLNKDD
jgi:UTP--glucose-1-phosphate uridylyltransferase